MIRADVEKVIAKGLGELGQHEQPFGSNKQKYGAWYGMNGAAWCAMFVSWVFWHAGQGLPPITTKKGFSYVEAARVWAKNNRTYYKGTKGIKRGDIILFSFGGQRADHVGIVLGVLSDGRIHTLEGNTDVSGGRTGGIVMEKYRRSSIDGYIRVENVRLDPQVDWAAVRRYLAATIRKNLGNNPDMGPRHPNKIHVAILQQALNTVSGAGLKEDGDYGPATQQAVQNFQMWMNKLGCKIDDPYGHVRAKTRFWLCIALDNIKNGKA